jgi:hypothetical protein
MLRLHLAALLALSLVNVTSVEAGCNEMIVREDHEVVVPIWQESELGSSPNELVRLSIGVRPLTVSEDIPYSFTISVLGRDAQVVELAKVSPFPALKQGDERFLTLLIETYMLPENPEQVRVELSPLVVGQDLRQTAIAVESARLFSSE